MIDAIIGVLVLLGASIAAYFTAVTYGWLAPDASWIPPVCRMDERTCRTVVETPDARVAGLPNSVLGLAYYALVAAWAASRPWPVFWETALVAATLWTLVLAAYLIHALRTRLQVTCPLCITAHLINGLLAVLVLGVVVGS